MKHSYIVNGIHCDSCILKIKTALLKVPYVTAVTIELASKIATVEMSAHITMEQLNTALQSTDYHLTHEQMLPIQKASAANNITFKNFLPLISAFSMIIFYTLAMMMWQNTWNAVYAMRHFEGAFFIIFGLLKLINWRGFVDAYQKYDVVAKHSRIYAYGYPIVELLIGIAYLTAFQLFITNFIVVSIMIIGAIGVIKALLHKQKIACACMGSVFKVPMTIVTLVEDILMGAMALLMIILM